MRIANRARIILIAFVVGIGLFAAYEAYLAVGPRKAHFIGVTSTSLERERLGNLSLHQSIKELNPAPEPDNNNALFDYYSWSDGMKIATNLKDDKIVRIIATAGHTPTSAGVRLGDSREKVIRTYGNNYCERTEQGSSIIGYVDKKLNRTLEFWFSDEGVCTIRLDIGSME